MEPAFSRAILLQGERIRARWGCGVNVMDAYRHLSTFQNEYHIFKNEECRLIIGSLTVRSLRGDLVWEMFFDLLVR